MSNEVAKERKFRHEFKYLVTDAQLEILKVRLMGIMKKDKHVGPNGIYCIKSLYFDDMNDRCFYENEDGVAPREKYRIRIYDNSAKRISLECKRKEDDKIHKTSCLITEEQFEFLAYGKGNVSMEELPPLAQKLSYIRYGSNAYRHLQAVSVFVFCLTFTASVALFAPSAAHLPGGPTD